MPEIIMDGLTVYFHKSERTAAAKRKILFIHGSGGNGEVWQGVMAGLDGYYETLAIDLPGHGRSQGVGAGNITEYSLFLKNFLDALGEEQIILGGHSLGGGIVQDFALRYPGRVRALLLIGTGGRLRVLPEVLENLRRMSEGEVPAKFDPRGFAPGASAEAVAEGERQWAKTNSRARYHDMLACDRFDLLARVQEISAPTLVLCGREDLMTPVKYSEFLQKKISGSKMEVIDGAGHMIMLEKPKELGEAILRFLDAL